MLHDRETLRGAQFGRPDASVAAAAGEAFEPELEVDLSACWPHSVACSNVRAVARRWSCRRIGSQSKIASRQLLGAVVRDGSVWIRGNVPGRRRNTRPS